MKLTKPSLLGVGVYTIPEAARLTGVPAQTIRRWLRGYEYEWAGKAGHSAPVWRAQITDLAKNGLLTFLDMMEVRFVDEFRKRGFSLQTIRRVCDRARELLDTDYPFSTQRFTTAGHSIFLKEIDPINEIHLLDLMKSEYAFQEILRPLLEDVRFENDSTVAWWPMHPDRRVIIDPRRSLGRPIVAEEGIPTATLHDSYLAEGNSIDAVVHWYEVSVNSVKAAVKYEESLNRKLAA